MSDVDQWDTIATGNSTASPDGAPELMPRAGVNDTLRETMAATKRVYDAPAWKLPFVGFVLARTTGLIFTLTDGGGKTDAAALMNVNQLVRMVQSSNTWIGQIVSVSYSSPVTTFTLEWQVQLSQDETGPTAAGTIELYQESGDIVFRNTGTAAQEVPINADLDPHTQTLEAELDVGFLDGWTRDELAWATAAGPLNFNGPCEIWQRGTSFTAATELDNSDGNVCADGYTIISNGADKVDISRDTDAPTGFNYSILLTAASNANFGLVVPVELEDSADVALASVTDKVSFSFYAREDPGAQGISSLRAYLVAIRSPTPAHPIAGWPSLNNDFTAHTNWEIIASANVTLTTAWQRFAPAAFEGIEVGTGSGSDGLAVIIHVNETTIVATSAWGFCGLQVTRGDQHVPFIRMPSSWHWNRALRYCETTFPNATMPGHNGGDAHALVALSSGTLLATDWRFALPKYKTPTVAMFNPGDAAPTSGFNWEDSASVERAATATDRNTRGVQILGTSATASLVHRIAAYVHANIWGAN